MCAVLDSRLANRQALLYSRIIGVRADTRIIGLAMQLQLVADRDVPSTRTTRATSFVFFYLELLENF